MKTIAAAALGLTLAAFSTAASALTVTFDNAPDLGTAVSSPNSGLYVENGVTVQATSGDLAYYQQPGAVHIDDAGTSYTSGVTLQTGALFSAMNFTIISSGYDTSVPSSITLTDNIRVSGLLGGSIVASASYTLAALAGTVQTFSLGGAFAALDSLLIELVYPTIVGGQYSCAPCGHFDLDEVVLGPAPVPLPASGGLMALGVGGLVVARRRRRAARG